MKIEFNYEDVKISEVKKGDFLKSYDIKDERNIPCEVLEVIGSEVEKQVVINYEGGNLVTSLNTFLFINGDYIEANEVKVGDSFINDFGEVVKVTDIFVVDNEYDKNFIDFKIDNSNNFFVNGSLDFNENSTFVLSHNSGIKDGAMTVSLSCWHMDILDFLKTQQFGGEEREKAMDLFLQLIFNDELMRRMKADEQIYLFDPYETKKKFEIFLSDYIGEEFTEKYNFLIEKTKTGEIELFTVIRAKDLFKEMLKTLIARGTPYVVFKDNINRVNTMKDGQGIIYSVNLCVESYSVFDTETSHACNLLSLVLPYIEKEEVEEVTSDAMELLNLTIFLSEAPTKSSAKHNNEIAAVGLGAMGLADWAAKNQMSYETEAGRKKANALFERISYFAIKASSDIAKELGSFKRFKDSKWSDGDLLGRKISEIIDRHDEESNGDLDWTWLSNKVIKDGIANGWLLAIAPNTTSSSAIGVSASILPTYAKAFVEETKCGNVMRMPLYIKEFPLGYKEYKHHDMFKMNSMIATIQFWIDAGISYEPIFDLNNPEICTTKYIFDFYMDAHEKGCKTVYYARWIKPGVKDMEAAKVACVGCSG